jgi:SNF1-activating kinase 1
VVDKLETTEQKVRKEIAIMKKLRHPHVVRLFEVIDDRLKDKIYMGEFSASRGRWTGTICTPADSISCLVMEFLAGGEVIWRYDDHTPRLAIAQSRRIIRDAVLGLEYRG